MVNKRNILIVAITRLGDMLQASPTIVGLKAQYPDARVTVLIEKNFASICQGIPGIDEVYELDLAYVCQCIHRERDGIVEGYRYIDRVVNDLQGRDFDFCLNMSSSAYTALLLKMVGIKECRGWMSDDEGYRLILDPWAMLFSAFVYHSNREYNSLNLVDIFRCSAGVWKQPQSLRYEIGAVDQPFGPEFIESNLSGDGPVIAIQAGASQEKRQWSPARFAALARLLIERCNARLVFTGSDSEQRIIEQVFSIYTHERMISAAGKTSLGQLASLLDSCDVLVTGDTGTMHLAVAVSTPVVALFLASALCFETGPYSAGNIVIQPAIECNPCNPNLGCSSPDCHAQISPELVTELVKLRLNCSNEELIELELSERVADSRQVSVYVTTFDSENYLEFVRISQLAANQANRTKYLDIARRAYRRLWKHEFNPAGPPEGALMAQLEQHDCGTSLSGAGELVALTLRGQELIEELKHLIIDTSSPPALLGKISRELTALDRAIEEVGLSHSLLGALVRLFVMEKENMRGDNSLELAQATGANYRALNRRARLYAGLFALESGADVLVKPLQISELKPSEVQPW